jgi:hypothetical protein
VRLCYSFSIGNSTRRPTMSEVHREPETDLTPQSEAPAPQTEEPTPVKAAETSGDDWQGYSPEILSTVLDS